MHLGLRAGFTVATGLTDPAGLEEYFAGLEEYLAELDGRSGG